MEVPRPGIKPYSLGYSCDLHHSCANAGSFNSLHQARDQTHASAVTQAIAIRLLTHCSTSGTPNFFIYGPPPVGQVYSRCYRYKVENGSLLLLGRKAEKQT